MIPGIDLSQIQGLVDGARVAAQGTRFAYHRAGVGNDGSDSCFDANVASLRAAGVVMGAYHVVYPLPDLPGHPGRDPGDQARLHYMASRALGEQAGELPPAADVEWPEPQDWGKWGCSPAQIKDWLATYLEETTRLYGGRRPVIYIYPDYQAHLKLGQDFTDYDLWLASYMPQPAIVAPWTSHAIWQNSGWDGKGHREGGVPGDGGGRLYDGRPVDTDLIEDEATLAALIAR